MSNNHPNRSWRSRWIVDLNTCTASHVDGWVFEFRAVEQEAWDSECIKQPMNPDFSQAARIAREAGDIYHEELKKRH